MLSITSSLQAQARDAYRRKDYKGAVGLFSRAIGRTPSVQLYDNRAACHDKLGDLPSALQDAKRAIQMSREDPTGYLRAGKILVKSDKKAAALDIYAYGLGKVRHVGAGYEQLKKEHDQLQGELAPRNSLDPFTVLPRELAVMILEYLSFRQRVLVTKVSKDWRRFIESEANLWRHLDFSGGKFKVSTKFVSKAINIARPKITTVTLHRLWDFDKVLNALVKHCPLESITLDDVGMLAPDLATTLAKAKALKEFRVLSGTKVSNRLLWDILPLCHTTLQVLAIKEPLDLRVLQDRLASLSSLAQLKRLELSITVDNFLHQVMEFLQAMSSRAPSMEHLRFHVPVIRWGGTVVDLDLTPFGCLKTADLRLPFSGFGNLCVPPSLERLQLEHGRSGSHQTFLRAANTDPVAAPPGLNVSDLPQLSSLSLRLPGLPIIDLEPFFNRPSLAVEAGSQTPIAPITEFALFQPEFPTPDVEVRLPKRLCTDLVSLTILECLKLDDKRVMELVTQLPRLVFLDISGSRITGAGVKDIILKRDTIRHLVLRDCMEISRDAVDWARAKGVKVENQMTSTDAKGGRKVVVQY